MAERIFINGMGVLGRELLRTLWGNNNFVIAGVNDPNISAANLCYLLKHDSMYHKWGDKNIVVAGPEEIKIDETALYLFAENDPSNLPLGELGVSLVLECTGKMTSNSQLQGFVNAGAKWVMACYEVTNNVVAYKINDNISFNDTPIISFAGMDTQVLARVLSSLNSYTVQGVVAKAFKSYTNSQPTIDSANYSEFAQGRAAATNITPLNDTFATRIGYVIPSYLGKVVGGSYRAPTMCGNIMNIVAQISGEVTPNEVKEQIKLHPSMLEYSEEFLCSSDAVDFTHPCILAHSIKACQTGTTSLIEIAAVYDNIQGYCTIIKEFLEEQLSSSYSGG